jgi:hypothetical protein
MHAGAHADFDPGAADGADRQSVAVRRHAQNSRMRPSRSTDSEVKDDSKNLPDVDMNDARLHGRRRGGS